MNCIFCDIAAGKAQASFVYQDEAVIGIMSLDQPNPYKVLIVPREHVDMIYALSHDQAGRIFQAAVTVARGIRAASGCAGMNLVQSNGKAGQQDVFHFHLHLVPRFENDDVILRWEDRRLDRFALEKLAMHIRTSIENRP